MKRKRFPPDDPREWINRAKSNMARARSVIPDVALEDLCFDAQQAAARFPIGNRRAVHLVDDESRGDGDGDLARESLKNFDADGRGHLTRVFAEPDDFCHARAHAKRLLGASVVNFPLPRHRQRLVRAAERRPAAFVRGFRWEHVPSFVISPYTMQVYSRLQLVRNHQRFLYLFVLKAHQSDTDVFWSCSILLPNTLLESMGR